MIKTEPIKKEERKHVPKQAEPERLDAPRQVEHDKKGFDRKAYMREYMRGYMRNRRRALAELGN